jgi:hypothetical protein
MPTIHRGRHLAVWIIATFAGWLGGVFAYPPVLPPTDVSYAVVIVFAGGATAGWLRGASPLARAWWATAYVFFVALAAALTCAWLYLRGWVFVLELVLPLAVAIVVFLPLHRWLSRRFDVEEPG